jgi:peptidyl-prolyl cis-trans isomerase SDCCAG10
MKGLKAMLWSGERTEPNKVSIEPAPESRCALHSVSNCESCRADALMPAEEEEVDETNWMDTVLRFEKDTKGKDLMRRRDNVDDYVVIDPRVKKLQDQRKEEELRQRKGLPPITRKKLG